MPDYPPLSQLAPKTFGTSSFADWLANMIGQGLTAPGKALASKEPMTSEQMIAPAQSMMALMGTGAPAAEAGALGAVGGRLAQPKYPYPMHFENAATEWARGNMTGQEFRRMVRDQGWHIDPQELRKKSATISVFDPHGFEHEIQP
jgi:hypothetical protein